MESLENMEEIEALQTELGQFLVSMMPVPWTKICFYAEAEPGRISTWFALIEKETDMICTRDFFWKRYHQYPVQKREVSMQLSALTKALFEAYMKRFGEDSVWRTIYYTLESDYSVHIDFEYEYPKGDLFEQHDYTYKRFFPDADYSYIEAKYPATE